MYCFLGCRKTGLLVVHSAEKKVCQCSVMIAWIKKINCFKFILYPTPEISDPYMETIKVMGIQELSLGGKSAASPKKKRHILLGAESFYSRLREAQFAFYFVLFFIKIQVFCINIY